MKKRFLCAMLIAGTILVFSACKEEEAPQETLPAENVNSLLDKYGDNEVGNETDKVANNNGNGTNSGGIPDDELTNDGNTNEEPTANSQQNTSKNNQGSNVEEQTTSRQQSGDNKQTSGSTTTSSNQGGSSEQSTTTKQQTTTTQQTTTKQQSTTAQQATTTQKATTTQQATTAKPAETTTTSSTPGGTVSGNVKWKLEGGTLTVYGSGAMPDYSAAAYPWYNYRTEITKVIVSDGVTSIGTYAFGGCARGGGSTSIDINYPALTYVEIADTVTKVNDSAFYYSENLVEVKMSNNVTKIGDYAFYACTSLTTLNLPATMKSFGGPLCFDQCNKSILRVYISSSCASNIKIQLSNWGITYIEQ